MGRKRQESLEKEEEEEEEAIPWRTQEVTPALEWRKEGRRVSSPSQSPTTTVLHYEPLCFRAHSAFVLCSLSLSPL